MFPRLPLLLVFAAISSRAVAQTYLTWKSVSPLSVSVPKLRDQTGFGRILATCDNQTCAVDPYTGAETCNRTLRLTGEYEPFSFSARAWKNSKNLTWLSSTTETSCTAIAANGSVLVLERDSAVCKLRSVRVGKDLSLPVRDDLETIITIDCSAVQSVPWAISQLGNAFAFAPVDYYSNWPLYVFARNEETGLWNRQIGDLPQSVTNFNFSSNGRLLWLNNPYTSTELYELNSSSMWHLGPSPPSVQSTHSVLLVNETMLLLSDPYKSQPVYESAGQVLVFTRSASFAPWPSSPWLTLQLDPGFAVLDDAHFAATAWLGEDRFLAKMERSFAPYEEDEMTTLIVDMSNQRQITVTRMNFTGVALLATDPHFPVVHNSDRAKVFYPLGVPSATYRNGFIAMTAGIAVAGFALLLTLCCMKKIVKKCKHCKCPSADCCEGHSHSHSTEKLQMRSLFHSRQSSTPDYTPSTPEYTPAVAPPPYSPPASCGPPKEEMDPELRKALETVGQGMAAAIVGVAQGKVSTDDAVSIVAMAILNAVAKCNFKSDEHMEKTLGSIVAFMDMLFGEVLPSMTVEARRHQIGLILEEVKRLMARMQKQQSLAESLDLIRGSLLRLWKKYLDNEINAEEAQKLMAVVVLAALRNCSISSAEELRGHVTVFTEVMMVAANDVAPAASAEIKLAMIQRIWEAAAALF